MENDTITAISTPEGEGGIGIVRISGNNAIKIAKTVFKPFKKSFDMSKAKTFSLHYGWVIDPVDKRKVDEVILSIMLKPHSYTREDVVEFNCHGGFIPLKEVLQIVIKSGARIAQPGEFTKRAFLNGRIDLVQAESVIEIIRAKTDKALRYAFSSLEGKFTEYIVHLKDLIAEASSYFEALIEFPEQEIDIDIGEGLKFLEGSATQVESLWKAVSGSRFLREHANIVVVGKRNVGKSSLVNAILKKDRCIVTPVPGTTRDIVRDIADIKGIPVWISDTAGLGATENIVEKEGISRAKTEIKGADLVLFVLDASSLIDDEDRHVLKHLLNASVLYVFNKIDIEKKEVYNTSIIDGHSYIKVSALEGTGLEELESSIAGILMGEKENLNSSQGEYFLASIRQSSAIEEVKNILQEAITLIKNRMNIELVCEQLRYCIKKINELKGEGITDDVLDRIFKNFCIGK
ncbi:tRNA uridine-5-carboxymethylaminomethyl(34) synthesis GTPase MnmE [bacterium Unc6]|nr:tRNA uridine-5-carboxymethylaminomethyl(34) synthesis GTPase MnmE [bacterium Unc6]